jgi:hypothetical protein
VARGGESGHRGVVTLELTATGQHLVDRVNAWRRDELSRIIGQLSDRQQTQVFAAFRLLVDAAGAGYGAVSADIAPALLLPAARGAPPAQDG